MARGQKTKLLWQNQEYRKQMSEAHKGKKTWMFGRKHKQESIKKMRESHFCGEKLIMRKNGYLYIYSPDHPFAICGRIPEQTFVIERHLGRLLTKNEIVHHINGIKTDNSIENLIVMDRKEHFKLHAKERGFGTKIQSNPLRDKLTGKFYAEDVLASR